MSSISASAFVGSLRKASRFAVLVGLGVATVTMVASGENTPSAPGGQSAAGATLTIDQIGQALDKYGKNTVNLNGHVEYSIKVPRGKWNINVIISLSPNGKVIWLTNSLTGMPDAGKVSAAALTNVLKKNTEIGPMFFSIANGSLRMSYPVPNYDLTSAGLCADVDALISTVVDTEALWNPESLTENAGTAPPVKTGPVNPLAK